MSAKRHIRCLLFDLGSTLWTRQEEMTHQAKETAYRRVGEMLRGARGGEISAAQDTLEMGRQVHKALAQQLHKEKRQRPEYEPDFAQATVQALRLLGLKQADLELGARIFEALRVRIPTSRVLFPDTLSTLEMLRQRGYILGVVTNRDHGGRPFHEDLQHMAISADLGIRKPNPDIFKHALERLNVAPEETAMVGDNLKADIAGAKKLNILGIWKPKLEARKEQHHTKQEHIVPDMTIENLQDLLDVF